MNINEHLKSIRERTPHKPDCYMREGGDNYKPWKFCDCGAAIIHNHIEAIQQCIEWPRIDFLPTKKGFYWAKWKKVEEGTVLDLNDDLLTGKWETVEVFENCLDKNDDEYLRVFVGGVQKSQPIKNFEWGPQIFAQPLMQERA